jgi:hypothetical protein
MATATMTPPHRIPLHLTLGRHGAAHCELVRLTSWIVLQQGEHE